MRKIKLFILGMIEFRQCMTTSVDDSLIEYYDKGRDFAHRITFRKFDN